MPHSDLLRVPTESGKKEFVALCSGKWPAGGGRIPSKKWARRLLLPR
jgi:hypothetical protein